MEILEAWKVEDDRLRAENEKLDKEYAKKKRELEKDQAGLALKITALKAELAKLKRQYVELEAKVRADEEAAIRSRAITKEAVASGQATLDEFYKSGLAEAEIQNKARAATDAKLAEALAIIRAKGLELLKLEKDDAAARRQIINYGVLPAQGEVRRLRQATELLERGIADVLGSFYAADAEAERADLGLRFVERKAITCVDWDSLGLDEIRDLKFDARLSSKHLADLEAFLRVPHKPDARFRVVLSPAAATFGRVEELFFQELDR